MSKILVVDDDDLLATSVVAYLEDAGSQVARAAEAAEAERLWRTWHPDVVVLDILLGASSGLDLLRRMRREADGTMVVLLSALATADDRIVGLEVGADDYLTKPFSPRELVLRVAALLRRGDGPGAEPTTTTLGPLTLDQALRTVTLHGRTESLTPREFELLRFLVNHAGRTFSSRELLRRVWGWDFGDDSTVLVHVRRLRVRLEEDPSAPRLLTTVRGTGYRWATAAEMAAAEPVR